jgi:hypothetical protein
LADLSAIPMACSFSFRAVWSEPCLDFASVRVGWRHFTFSTLPDTRRNTSCS